MKLITRWDRAKTMVVERQKWCDEHPLAVNHVMVTTTKKLEELGPNPHPDTVNEILGGAHSWTILQCCECNKEVNEVVEMGRKEDPLDDDAGPQHFCAECILKALQLIEE